MARPRRYVDRKLLKELCMAQLTNDEIARCLRVSWDTLERRYAEAIKAWRVAGPGSVRRKLYTTATGPDDAPGRMTAMIFYLKNYGGMADNHRIEDSRPLDFGNLPMPADPLVRAAGKPN